MSATPETSDPYPRFGVEKGKGARQEDKNKRSTSDHGNNNNGDESGKIKTLHTDVTRQDIFFHEPSFAESSDDSVGLYENRSSVLSDIKALEDELGIETESVLNRIAKLEEKVRSITRSEENRLENFGGEGRSAKEDDEEDDDDEDHHFSQDCYSMIALNGPTGNRWPKDKISFFLFGLNLFFFQFGFLFLMIWSRIDADAGDIESDNPHDTLFQFVPSNSKNMIRAAQFISIMAFTLFPESSLIEIFKAFQYFPTSEARKNDPNGFITLSCILRGIQGYMAILAVFLVLITSDTVVDIILNFTALNFISGLDDDAFSLARSGMFGKGLKKEAKRIEKIKLPPYVARKSKFNVHWTVMGSTAALLFSLLVIVITVQIHTEAWVTNTLRLGFRDDPTLSIFNGCYEVNPNPRIKQRRTYDSLQTIVDSSFGYCESESRWILFEGNAGDIDPCEVGDLEIARSAETREFDISASFEESWFYPSSKIPIDLFFEGDGDTDDLNCDLFLGDGICDEPFNDPGYAYDHGDCCAATCTASHCGETSLANAFGNSSISSGIVFPDCRDPRMHPITIKLNEIKSSRDEKFGLQPCFEDLATMSENEWRAKTPANPYLYLECDGRSVLSISVEKSMENHTETVWVEDGARCTFGVTNTTHTIREDTDTAKLLQFFGNFCKEPIWYVNYTIFHGSQLEILTQYNNQVEYSSFKRIPECYLSNLKHQVDLGALYEPSSPLSKAIDWLRMDDSGYSDCANEFFIERFALTSMEIAMKDNNDTKLANAHSHCFWPGMECNTKGSVTKIDLPKSSLKGAIPSELALLTNLEQLYLYENEITAIPSEIASMDSMTLLYLHDNNFTSMPSEVFELTNLEVLTFDMHYIGSLPQGLWQLTNLHEVHLGVNSLTYIPSEIGLLTNLEIANLSFNRITSIPSEIGMLMDSLELLNLFDNNIVALPTEIGLLKNLRSLWCAYNQLTYIPTEIGQMTNLKQIKFDGNELFSTPSTLYELERLILLQLNDNEISIIPSEIGRMTGLEWLDLAQNQMTSIPSEIGLLANLSYLDISGNNIQVLPSEIGLLTALTKLLIHDNNFTDIPTEIESLGVLTLVDSYAWDLP